MEISGGVTRGSIPSQYQPGIGGAGYSSGPTTAAPAGITADVKKMGAQLAPPRGASVLDAGRVALNNGTPPGQLPPPRGGQSFGSPIPQGGGQNVQGAANDQASALDTQEGKAAQSKLDQQKHELIMKFIEGARG